MDELDNSALSLLLILDDDLFPQLLDWSASQGWSDLIIFLLETDYFRFKTNGSFEEADCIKPTLFEAYHLIRKNAGGHFGAFFTPEKLNALNRLLDSGIPLNSVYSQICNGVWKELLVRASQIVDSSSWPSVRRSLVENYEISLEEMLSDASKRLYFDRYIQGEPCDLAALQCLLSVRRILKDLSKYKLRSEGPSSPSTPQPITKPTTSKTAEFFGLFGIATEDGGSSIMRRWRASKNAVTSASKALQAPFAQSTHSLHPTAITSQHQCTNEYSDPFEAFKVVLEGTRKLQKQFFPSSTAVSGANSAFTSYTTATNSLSGYAPAPYRENDSSDSNTNTSNSGATSPRNHLGESPNQRRARPVSGGGSQRNCSGISEALRIEIQNTLTVNASVRAREIDTVDRAFAFACTHILEQLLLALEKEMLTYVADIFDDFVETTDYAKMVAHARALNCQRIADYTAKLEFLYDRVRQQRIISWKDMHTKGKVFLAYEQLSAEGEVPLPSFSAPNSPSAVSSPGRSARNGTARPVPSSATIATAVSQDASNGAGGSAFKPNVVAISLELVMPHTTLLSPSTVASCPHRVTLYAGGKRRAARLRSKKATESPASRSAVLRGASDLGLKATSSQASNGTASHGVPPLSPARGVMVSTPKAIDSPTRSPMRRMSSVKFHLGDVLPSPTKTPFVPIPDCSAVPALEEIKTDSEVAGPDAGASEADVAVERQLSDSDHEGCDDTLSDLPSVGIAGSIKSRTITSANSIGAAGADCFNDILSASSSFTGHSSSGIDLIDPTGEADADEEVLVSDVESTSSSSAGDSDSSSDYDGDVRHVYSSADLDQLMRTGYSPTVDDVTSSADNNDSPQLTPRGTTARYPRSRRGSAARLISRTASYASVGTTGTGATSMSRANSGINGGVYEENTRRLVAIDFTKLDRSLHKEVLGTALVPAESQPVPTGSSASKISGSKRVAMKNLVASLAVALAAAKEDDDQFGRKFLTNVEEAFTFTTDTRSLGLLNDLLFSKRPNWQGAEQITGYVKSFETAMSVFRQNAMLDTTRQVYRVSVQIQSTPVSHAEASRMKAQLASLEADPRHAASRAPLHPTHTHSNHHHHGHHQHHHNHSIASKIQHSHIRIAVSYTRLIPEHTMLTALESISFAACAALQPASGSIVGSERSGGNAEEKLVIQTEPPELPPMPLKIRYIDSFSGQVRGVATTSEKTEGGDKDTSRAESLYELYLGTHPGFLTDSPQSVADRESPPLCEPINKHLGVCDFSLSEMLTTVSARLMMQILMLVLVDRPVMLVSTSSTLLSQVQAAIPRLIWPFRIGATHVVRQILSGAELHHFVYRHDVPFVTESQQPVIREKKLNRKASSWREIITRIATNVGSTLKGAAGGGNGSGGSGSEPGSPGGAANAASRSPRGSFTTRQRKSGSSGDLLAGMARRSVGSAAAGALTGTEEDNNSPVNLAVEVPAVASSPQPGSRSPYTRILTPPSLQLPTPVPQLDGEGGPDTALVDQFSCILGVDANAFYTAPTELRDDLENMRIRGSGFTFIDIDSGIILNRRPDDISEDDGEAPPKPLPSRLSDSELFRAANFGLLRSLIKSVARVNDELVAYARSLHSSEDEYGGLGGNYAVSQIAAALTRRIVASNREIEKSFYAFWSELVLRAIPRYIQHFPGPKVISCDIRAVLTELLHTVVASSASYEMGEDCEDLLAPAGSSDAVASDTASVKQSASRKAADALITSYARQLPPAIPPNRALLDNMNKLPFEEFLAMFVEQVASHGETNVCYAFYKEFIADGSVVFKNLLLRHSAVLESWNI